MHLHIVLSFVRVKVCDVPHSYPYIGHAVVQYLCDRTVFLMAAEHQNHLSSDPDGHVFATVNKLGWEMWKYEEVTGTEPHVL